MSRIQLVDTTPGTCHIVLGSTTPGTCTVQPIGVWRPPPPTSNRYRCDGCAQEPISGTIYHCSRCNDYDLCPSCHLAGDVHPAEHPMLARPPTHQPRYNCDGCGKEGIVGNVYHCRDCRVAGGFDVCDACFETHDVTVPQHATQHRFQRIPGLPRMA